MRRKRLLVILVIACAVLAGSVLLFRYLSPGPGVTLENFKRIRKGMTERDVEAILGTAGEKAYMWHTPCRIWQGKREKVGVVILFSEDGLVQSGLMAEPRPDDGQDVYNVSDEAETFWDRLRRLLR
jgi:hypothetical protein